MHGDRLVNVATDGDGVRPRDGTGSGETGAASAGQSQEVLDLIDEYLDQVAADTHRLLGEVAGVAVTMADRRGRPLTVGSSTELARAVDELQYRLGDGPCLNALRGGGGDYVPSLAADTRWGRYGPEAAELGARCCQSVPVEGHDGVVAVFKVYAGVVYGLTLEQRRLAVRRCSAGGRRYRAGPDPDVHDRRARRPGGGHGQ